MQKNTRNFNRRSFLKTSAFVGAGVAGTFAEPALSTWALDAALDEADPTAQADDAPKFAVAEPVWQVGREKEMNVTLVFYGTVVVDENFEKSGAKIRSTGSTVTRLWVNDEIVGYGPARGPHGWFRVDEWDVSKYLNDGENVVYAEVAGYNCNSYYLIDQPSFLQAEVVDGAGKVVLATTAEPRPTADGPASFAAIDATGLRVQKVQRFSFQRPFIEVYDSRGFDEFESVPLAKQPEVKYLPRRVPYPEFAIVTPIDWGKTGKATPRETLENPWRDRSLVNIGPKLKGYKLDELEVVLSDEIQRLETKFDDAARPLGLGSTFREGDVRIVEFGANYCGFFGFEIENDVETSIAITFDEILTDDGDVDFLRLGTCSAAKWTKGPSTNGPEKVETFEPYCAKYAKIHCLKGSFKLTKFYLREYAHPATRDASFSCADERLERIYRAAALTFRENSVDAFTDCPHRERAGWLCDGFFIARSAFDFTGKTDVEDAFLENYSLPEKFEFLPDGMLPMCYPADHNDGIFIPSWALWLVCELAEYARRTPNRRFVDAMRVKVEKLFRFFEQYENADGLLEKLPSWVFVEWSAANDFVQDVNYPNNMIYAAALDRAGALYGVDAWREKAAAIRAKIVEQSFDGEFFVDRAVRKEDGSLEVLRDRTEVCQYFAFFFETATPESQPELWAKLLNEFGPNRVAQGGYPEIHKANSFVGNVLRLELLAAANRGDQLLDESVAYNLYMAERTGTLWENDTDSASCDHGFASHVVRVFYRDVLGVADVDAASKKLAIRLPKLDKLAWAAGVRPVPGGAVKLRWEKKDGKLEYSLETPDGYEVAFENASGLEAVRR